MALHLNLYHEITQQKTNRRRDPLKLGVYGLVLIGICLAGYYFFRLNSVRLAKSDLSRLKANWGEISVKQKLASEREKELVDQRRVVESLRNNIETRLFWAPFLQDFGECVPQNVQITNLAADVTAENQLVVNIEGIAAGIQPRSEAESFRVKLAKVFGERYVRAESTFRSLEDGTEHVQLEGKDLGVASFSIRMAIDATEGRMTEVPDQRLTSATPLEP